MMKTEMYEKLYFCRHVDTNHTACIQLLMLYFTLAECFWPLPMFGDGICFAHLF